MSNLQRLPAERFYWAVLDTSNLPHKPLALSGIGSSHTTRTQLGYLFESVLPVEIESVHAAYLPLSDTRILACAMNRAELDQALADDAMTLGPDSLPPFIDEQVDLARLNLLTGTLQPPRLKRLSQRNALQIAAAIIICATLFFTGTQRRTIAARELRADALAAADQMRLSVLPTGPTTQPAALRLISQLRKLERTRTDGPDATRLIDAAEPLSELLALWPAQLHATTESMIITPEAITIIAQVPTHADAQSLANALSPMPGWQLQQPQVAATRGVVRTTIRLLPETAP